MITTPPIGDQCTVCEAAEPCECDLNGDGRCDGRDWNLFIPDWGRDDCPIPQM